MTDASVEGAATTADAMVGPSRRGRARLVRVPRRVICGTRRPRAGGRAQSRGVRERMDGMNACGTSGARAPPQPSTLVANVDGRDHERVHDARCSCAPALSPSRRSRAPTPTACSRRGRYSSCAMPEHLVVLGAKPTCGCEFSRLLLALRFARDAGLARDQLRQTTTRPRQSGARGGVFLRRRMDVIKNEPARLADRFRGPVEALRLVLEDGRDLTSSHLLSASGCGPHPSAWALGPADGGRVRRGTLPVDDFCRTNIPHIYACGDVTGQIMLANTASLHGRTAALTRSASRSSRWPTGRRVVRLHLAEIAWPGSPERQARLGRASRCA